jgi:alkylation response protein AidB-like acyl-CoA dehydrogenase
MPQYRAPVERMKFVIEQVLDAPAQWVEIPAFADIDAQLAGEILDQAAHFTQNVLAPLNSAADLEGCTWSPEGVKTPKGFPEAYQAYVGGGWPALACDPDIGGQGLPQLLNTAVTEMVCSANHAWAMYPGLLHGAYEAVKAVAVPELRALYLPKLVSGEWLGTMALTEPHAGSDLGLLRTKAECVDGPALNGARVRVSGQKIFISGGEQDMTSNIVHLVLGRLPGGAPGTKGLSLFLVPKILPDGRVNTVYCDGIEKKMGIKGSATCQMRFDHAEGWLLGESGTGLATMFLMMNSARLQVSMQGVGHLEAAAQYATAYAVERTQSRAPKRPEGVPAVPADVIAWHPAMRRILLTLQANTEAARLLSYWTAQLLDEHEHHPDADRRKVSGDLVALLTPIVKAFLTELGHRSADDALGVFGGHGYVHEWLIEQHVRDSRIAMIYEGSNEIQAIDLIMRKVLDGSPRLDRLLSVFSSEVQACGDDPALQPFSQALSEQMVAIEQSRDVLVQAKAIDPERVLQVADDFLPALGYALFAWAWTRLARKTPMHPDPAERERLATLTNFGISWVLPAQQWRWQSVKNNQRVLPWVPLN